jgi:inner membrane protein
VTDPLVPRARRAGESTLVRLVLLGLVVLAVLVPLGLVGGLLGERRARGAAAAAEIAHAWGGVQRLAPPALRFVHACEVKRRDGETELRRTASALLPERLGVAGRLESERRARGIFSTVVYRAALELDGEFVLPPAAASGDCPAPLLQSVTVTVGVGDNRGIDRISPFEWPGTAPSWQPGGSLGGPWRHGVSARLDPGAFVAGARLPFRFELDLRGSETLELLPVGRETAIELGSAYPSPSFRGAFLPARRTLGATGFAATWRISPFARSFPQSWLGDAPPEELAASALGVALVDPVDGYLQSERAQKYALLVVGLTFLACFLLELRAPVALHPVHYLLVGGALALFYLLLLALSEHLGFDLAYATAAAAVTSLLAGYATAVLASARRGALLGGTLAACYGGLYLLLGREEYALLVGSIGTFAALATTMWLTRSTDWRTAFRRPESPAPAPG